MVAILAENGILRAETLRFADELRKPDDVGLPKVPKVAAGDVKKFETQIAKNAKKVNLREFLDDYTERLEKLVAQKERKKEDIVRAPEEPGDDEGAGGGEVVDLLAVLSRSLGGKPPAKRASARSSAAKARPAKRAPARRASGARKAARPKARSRRS
jgi:DNA end-binding protein Ku